MQVPEEGAPSLLSAATLDAEDVEPAPAGGGTAGDSGTATPGGDGSEPACDGLSVALSVSSETPGELPVTLPFANATDRDWRGTVELTVGDRVVPVDLGRVAAGETVTDSVTLDVDEEAGVISGSLLIGP
ncbi:hypothetical protein BH24ACT3_BH24ACT3_11020 [soil metagenome]